MPRPLTSRKIIQFDEYALDLSSGELHKSGHKIRLQGQPFQVLAILLQRPREVVTREELREKLWPRDTFVDFDHSLNTAIKKLRQALNDEAGKPRYIETLPRRGYRFMGLLNEKPITQTPELERPQEPAADLVGGIFVLRDQADKDFICVPIDETTLKEKEKLEAADDNLGLSLLSASERLLVIRTGTRVKVLGGSSTTAYYEVRILEGEHIAKTAIVPRNSLNE